MFNNIVGNKVSQLVAGLGVGYVVLTGAAGAEASQLEQQQADNNQSSKIINNMEMGNIGGGFISDNSVVKLDGSGHLAVSNVDTSKAEFFSKPEVMKMLLTKDSFSNMQSTKGEITQICERFGIKDVQKVFDQMYDMNTTLKSEINNHLNKYGSDARRFRAAKAGIDNLSGEGLVYYPFMRMKDAPGNENSEAFVKSPNQLNHIEDYIYNNKNNQAYAGFCLQHKYMMEGKDSLELVMSKEKAEAFHDKFGELNRVNALMVPFYADTSDKNLEKVSRDGCNSRMNTAADRRFKEDGMCKYDRGVNSGKGYTLDADDVKAISYEYGMGTVLELQNMKPYFFDKGAIQYIDQCKNIQSAIMGENWSTNGVASLTDNTQTISNQYDFGQNQDVSYGDKAAGIQDQPYGLSSHDFISYGDGKGSEGLEYVLPDVSNEKAAQEYVKGATKDFLDGQNRLTPESEIKVSNVSRQERNYILNVEATNVLPSKESRAFDMEFEKSRLDIPKGKVFEPFNMKDIMGKTDEFNKSAEALAAAKVDEKVAGLKLREHRSTYTNENGGMFNGIKSRIAVIRDFGSVDKMNAETNRLSDKAAEAVKATSVAGKSFDNKITELRGLVESKCNGDKTVMGAFDKFASDANAFKYAVSEGYQKTTREAMSRMQDSYKDFGNRLADFGKAQDRANIDKEKEIRSKVIECSPGFVTPSMAPAEFYCSSVNRLMSKEGQSMDNAEKMAAKALVKTYGVSVAEPVMRANAVSGVEPKGAKALVNNAVKSIKEEQKKVENQAEKPKAKSVSKTRSEENSR